MKGPDFFDLYEHDLSEAMPDLRQRLVVKILSDKFLIALSGTGVTLNVDWYERSNASPPIAYLNGQLKVKITCQSVQGLTVVPAPHALQTTAKSGKQQTRRTLTKIRLTEPAKQLIVEHFDKWGGFDRSGDG